MKKLTTAVFLVLLLISYSGYGDKVETGGVEVYYNLPELKDQAKEFSTVLDSLEHGKEGTVIFQLVKDSLINLNMLTQDKYHTDESLQLIHARSSSIS
jgi:predicted CopG family antitoxin